MIKLSSKGGWNKTYIFLKKTSKGLPINFSMYGKRGVMALSSATPVDTGKTASSWNYRIEKDRNRVKLIWYNTNVNQGINIAILIQYGHGTKNGTYVQGIDYINPALRPIFDEIADKIWKEVQE